MNPEDLNVLLVDDEDSAVKVSKFKLKRMGFKSITVAKDGKAALGQLFVESFDLIIADWRMPGMDGLELFKAIQEQEKFRNIPFILRTGENLKEKIVEALEAGVKNYILKSLQGDDLEQKIKSVLSLE